MPWRRRTTPFLASGRATRPTVRATTVRECLQRSSRVQSWRRCNVALVVERKSIGEGSPGRFLTGAVGWHALTNGKGVAGCFGSLVDPPSPAAWDPSPDRLVITQHTSGHLIIPSPAGCSRVPARCMGIGGAGAGQREGSDGRPAGPSAALLTLPPRRTSPTYHSPGAISTMRSPCA